jgi:hypothetical protein
MDADEFRDYILGFIFYKYLPEKMASYASLCDISISIPSFFDKYFWTVQEKKEYLHK